MGKITDELDRRNRRRLQRNARLRSKYLWCLRMGFTSAETREIYQWSDERIKQLYQERIASL